MELKKIKELIQKTKTYAKSPIALELIEDFEAFIDLKHQAAPRGSDYNMRLEEARQRFMNSAQTAAVSFGINPQTLQEQLKRRVLDPSNLDSESIQLRRAITAEEEPKKVSRRSLKNKTRKV